VRRFLGLVMLTVLVAFLCFGCAAQAAVEKPNILFVLTDDQSERLMSAMPSVRTRVAAQGVTFDNAYITQPLCCPSRATFLRGQYPHNHGVTDIAPPDGGEARFRDLDLDESTFATWLNDAGYRTGFVGKYLNGYKGTYVPPGWDSWVGRIDYPGGHSLNENGNIYGVEDAHMTDIYRQKAMRFLRNATDSPADAPFLLAFWTNAPHLPAASAARHARLYRNDDLDTSPSFNERDVSDKPAWIRSMPRFNRDDLVVIRDSQRQQKRSLRAVDEAVNAMLSLLAERGELDNTYVVFTSDNGVAMGEHRYYRKEGAKSAPYEETAGVPFVVRGPGVSQGTAHELVANNDLAPTLAQWAGVQAPTFVDGRSLIPVLGSEPPSSWRTALLTERHAGTSRELAPDHDAIIAEDYTYVEYLTGEKELYDLNADPYQLESIHDTADPALLENLHIRLGALKGCASASCQTAEGP
jgi:N-acetylglucosamine-6-sulfatase